MARSQVALLLAVLALGVSHAAAVDIDVKALLKVGPLKLCCQKADGTCDPSIFKTDGPYTLLEIVAAVTAFKQCKLLDVDVKVGGSSLAGVQKGKLCQPAPTSGAEGDPHIKGFDGSNYLLWGKPNTTYSLVSEKAHQINIRLYHPPGRAEAHALYIDAVGALINDARITVSLAPGSPSSLVLGINGGQVTFPGHRVDRAIDVATSFSFESADRVVINSRDLSFTVLLVENDHLDIQVTEVAAYWNDVHGIIGQTHSKAFQLKYRYSDATVVGDMPTVEAMAEKKQLSLKGKEDDYIVSDLLKADDKFNRFAGSAGMSTTVATRKMLSATRTKTDAGSVSGLPADVAALRKLQTVSASVYVCL